MTTKKRFYIEYEDDYCVELWDTQHPKSGDYQISYTEPSGDAEYLKGLCRLLNKGHEHEATEAER